jgi:hypothetical protein
MKKLLQKIGDEIIKLVENAPDKESLIYFYLLGLKFDMICVDVFNIYLD